MSDIQAAKRAARDRAWSALEEAVVVEPGVHGHIPDFIGADLAAQRLAGLTSWQAATVVEVVPDKAQYSVRLRALAAGKLLYMAVPQLAEAQPFYCLDPAKLAVRPDQAADRQTAARIAPTVEVAAMRPVELVVCGSVAVSTNGTRLGKGAGYSDIEMALLTDAGLLTDTTMIVTTVHELQVTQDELPEDDHDFRVDVIVTPDRVIGCGTRRRPSGLNWDVLRPDQIAAIPALQRHPRHGLL
jgi:5-formyltetrahydrofolate cyclo-ligase